MSRLGRSGKDIRDTLSALHELKILLVFHSLNGMEGLDEQGRETFTTNLILAIYAEVAYEERRILVERTFSGLAYAQSRGRIGGRPTGQKESAQKFMCKHRVLIGKLKEHRLSDSEISKPTNISINTVKKVKKLLDSTHNCKMATNWISKIKSLFENIKQK